ncbi:[Pyruvate dehydrogenase (acetyl-transferring)] kinase isozyme 4 [Cichlidogyrus casuarinus]|uniref:Protein-serine/threonine kinase n=1 Tax=Cichlidogyrus casuarinus TaxID=1844966 RepID=A0ABD2PQH9_9PLAT
MSDRGAGIPRSIMDLVFQYTYTTGQDKHKPGGIEETPNAPLAGYGYGLPLSRLYARYFNGDLTLSSVEGYGTDVMIYLKRSETEADEVLPVFNTTTRRHYGLSSIPVRDWLSSIKRS